MAFQPASNTKQRGIDSTNRGAARWERAARNALRNPHSKAAMVYRERTALAHMVSSARLMTGVSEQAWQFMGVRSLWAKDDDGQFTYKPYRGRVYATCSTYCTVLQMTLDFSANTLEKVAAVFSEKYDANHDQPWKRTVDPLDPKTLRRPVHCYVCTREIK